MKITWFDGEPKEIILTINEQNLTINKPGIHFFESANQVMLGYDKSKTLAFIKPLSKEDVLRGDIDEHMRYNITVTQSYARVANKAFINKLANLFNLDLDEKGLKFKSQWLKNEELLLVDLKEVLSHD